MARVGRLVGVIAAAVLAVAALPTLVSARLSAGSGGTYRAAAVQFTPSGGWNVPAAEAVQQSVDRFEPFVQQAAQQGAQVVVFPEGGTAMFDAEIVNTRDAMFPYCVEIGDVASKPNPCAEQPPAVSSPFYQTWRVSCLAKKYHIIVAMNLCETRPCTNGTGSTDCPADGRFQWNTQVVFDETGTVVLKYHKAHLFGGSDVFDQASPASESFVSSFGVRFGTFICFDIMYAHPAGDLVAQGVTDFLFTSYWVNSVPTTNAMMQQQAWSRLHGVNLIASNVGTSPANGGGGIYSSGEVLASWFRINDENVNQLLIADLPIRSHQRRRPVELMRSHTRRSRRRSPKWSPPPSSLSYEPCKANVVMAVTSNCTAFTPASLRKAALAEGVEADELASLSFTIPISNGGVACSVEFNFDEAVDPNEQFIALAYEGTQTFPFTPSPLTLQVCALQHCIPDPAPAFSRHRRLAHTPSAVTSCRGSWGAYNTKFSSFSITAMGFDAHTAAFPMLAVDDGQLVTDTSYASFKDTPAATRVVQWASTPAFRNQSLSSALLYGVKPNP